jgi:Protein prenyltransferase alpha subunit repeat
VSQQPRCLELFNLPRVRETSLVFRIIVFVSPFPSSASLCTQCLEATGANFQSEWGLCWAIGETNAKNYQLWNHRRRCALAMGAGNADRELEFAAHFLAQDAKNYHIWAHRQVRDCTYPL